MRLSLAALLVVATSVASADELSAYVNRERLVRDIPGMVLATIKNGHVDRVVASGMASLDLKVPVTRDTVFEIGSMTKAFTAELIMMLVEDGKVKLDEKISKYLEGCPETWKDISVRNLLNHTSGLPNYTSIKPGVLLLGQRITYPEIFDLVKDMKLEFAPGDKFEYSNTNYYFLGQIIENVSGKEYTDFLKERILEPLKMTKTRPQAPRSVIENRSVGYMKVGNALTVPPLINPDSGWAAGYLVSTVDDLAKWDDALLKGKLLKKESYDEMYKVVPIKDGTSPYGFGWDVSKMNGHVARQHGGGTAGFSSYILRLPDDKLSVVVLSNLAQTDVASIARGAARIVLPELSEKAILDPDPKLTKFHREIVEKIIDNSIQRTPFAKETADELFPNLIEQARQMLLSFGKLTKFELLEHKLEPGLLSRRYRMVFEKARMQLFITENSEHKIVTIFIRAD